MIYAIGDIHGDIGKLNDLLAQVQEDAAAHSDERHELVFLGDYIDRGNHSHEVIETLRRGIDGFEAVFIFGNHEEMLLNFVEEPSRFNAETWVLSGGAATLAGYGTKVHDIGTFGEKERIHLTQVIPTEHIEWIQGLSVWHRSGGYVFVHAGIKPGIALEDQRLGDLIWIRREFLESQADHGAVVVHGHTVCRVPEVHANRIGIDTGCGQGGPLTCAVLGPDMAPRFLQSR